MPPVVIGEEAPNPTSLAFQATFSLAVQRTGSPVSEETPWLDGPRHCGQSSATNHPDDRRDPIKTAMWIPLGRAFISASISSVQKGRQFGIGCTLVVAALAVCGGPVYAVMVVGENDQGTCHKLKSSVYLMPRIPGT